MYTVHSLRCTVNILESNSIPVISRLDKDKRFDSQMPPSRILYVEKWTNQLETGVGEYHTRRGGRSRFLRGAELF